jgi:hypothetical protein
MGAWHQDRLADWLSVSKLTSTSTTYYSILLDVSPDGNSVGLLVSWVQNILLLQATSKIRILYVTFTTSGPPLWSSGQSSWLRIQRSGFDSRRYQIFWEVMGLERGPLSLMSTIEELLGRKSNGSGLESRVYGRRDPSRWPRGTLYPQKLSLTSPICGGLSIGIVRSWNQATEFFFLLLQCTPNALEKTQAQLHSPVTALTSMNQSLQHDW